MANALAPDLPGSVTVATHAAPTRRSGHSSQKIVYPPIAPAEWEERGQRVQALLDEWMAEEPREDVATWEELEAGLKASPVRFREVKIDG